MDRSVGDYYRNKRNAQLVRLAHSRQQGVAAVSASLAVPESGVGQFVPARGRAPQAGPTITVYTASTQTDAEDEELLIAARCGDDSALNELLGRFRPLARGLARRYFLVGASNEDVVQEAMIGLYKAIRAYEPGHPGGFRGFAAVCVNRQLIDAVKAARRFKHQPLADRVPLNPQGASGHQDEGTLAFPGNWMTADPAELVVAAETMSELLGFLRSVLTDLETKVLQAHLQAQSYTQIAAALDRSEKSIDNALHRARRKLTAYLAHERRAEARCERPAWTGQAAT